MQVKNYHTNYLQNRNKISLNARGPFLQGLNNELCFNQFQTQGRNQNRDC
jgi:hypothetical protein